MNTDQTTPNTIQDTFRDIFERTLARQSGSRPPKIRLTGVLVPIGPNANIHRCSFKLETADAEYFLRMSSAVSKLARKLEWEEVTVKGSFASDDAVDSVFDVEKIVRRDVDERLPPYLPVTDLYFEIDRYRSAILRRGILDTAPDYLAS